MNQQSTLAYRDYPILFVDDEEDTLRSFSEQFEGDFTIHTARDAKTALKILKEKPEIAVLITDQRMPEMTGIEFLREAMELRPETVRILITAYTEMDVVINAINTGNVYRYVSKPYKENDLRITVRQAIEKYFLVRERDRLYAEKVATMRKVAQTNRLAAIGTLAAGMAHEINNPLVAVSTFLQMLPQHRKSQDEEYWTDFYGVAVKEVHRIKTLIAELLSYSKDTKSAEIYAKDVNLESSADLNRIVNEVVLLLYNEAKSKKNEFELRLMKDLPQGKMDQEKIRQVIINLVLNAIQATENGKITISSSYHAGEKPYLELVVSDTGVGISGENLEKLFNPFFTTKDEGTGLGLMTCYYIIDQHRGNIDVQSKLGKGTQVIFQIPIDPMKHDRRSKSRDSEPI
jgi:signal transduction histidine kinase